MEKNFKEASVNQELNSQNPVFKNPWEIDIFLVLERERTGWNKSLFIKQ